MKKWFGGLTSLLLCLTLASCFHEDVRQTGTWTLHEDALELVGIHSALLPNGKVLSFGYKDSHHFVDEEGRYQLWDPQTMTAAGSSTVIQGWNPFCSGHAFLGDMRLFVAGGFKFGDPARTSSADKVGTFRSDSDSSVLLRNDYRKMEDMRWYPTVVTLASGDALILGGSAPFAADNWKDLNEDYEYFSVANDRLITHNETRIEYPNSGDFPYPDGDPRQKIADGKRLVGLYPLTHLLPSEPNSDAPDGILFVLNESFLRLYNPTTNTILNRPIDVGGFKSWWTQGSSVLLPIDIDEEGNGPDSVSVMVIGGGSLGTNDSSAAALNTLNIYGYDVRSRTISLRHRANLNRNRFMGDGVLLPDGNVVVIGGAEVGYTNDNNRRVRTAELVKFLPDFNVERVVDLAQNSQLRGYHASTLLLPDGSIFFTGGNGNWDNRPVQEFKSVEIFVPPYISDPPGGTLSRPNILSSPDELKLGQRFTVQTSDVDVLAQIVLVRHGSRTHSLDTDQRMLRFAADKVAGPDGVVQLRAKMPGNGSYIPPGPYMVYLLKPNYLDDDAPQDLIPSRSRLVHVTGDSEAPEAMVEGMRFTIRTGGDNLERDNRAFLEVTDATGSSVVDFQLNAGPVEFPNNTVNTFSRTFSPAISSSRLHTLKIRHTAENCGTCGDDNWDVARVIVEVNVGGVWGTIYDRTLTPLFRLTGTDKAWQTPL